jgi:hypothetical protein
VTDDNTPTDPEQDPEYRYATLMGIARAGHLTAEGYQEVERLRADHPEVAEAFQ